jgi:glutathione synthase/RimK-type ligase-like ATP-grasp enzyme
VSELPDDAADTALLAASALGCDLVGIDLLRGPHGYVVLDADAAVEFTAAYGLRGVDPFEEAARALLENRDGRIRTGGLLLPKPDYGEASYGALSLY